MNQQRITETEERLMRRIEADREESLKKEARLKTIITALVIAYIITFILLI